MIEEGEEHIKDIDAKIPRDLKTVREDIRARYSKLKFMIKEYQRDHKTTTNAYQFVKSYLDKSSHVLKRIKNMNLATDEDAEIKRLEDEKSILEMMINKMKQEIQGTQEDFKQRFDRLEKIHKLSENNKLDLLEYYNKLESLCISLEKLAVTGGDNSPYLKEVIDYTNKEDELMDAICQDLLKDTHTSTSVVTSGKIERYFNANREKIYRDCFTRKANTTYNLFGKSMFYMYYYLFMDRLMFEKRYAVPHILKDDSKLSKDVRLLNYIEEALKEGNIEESHVFAMQLSDKMKADLKEFIDMCEAWIKYRITIQTIRDHSGNLLSTNFGLK